MQYPLTVGHSQALDIPPVWEQVLRTQGLGVGRENPTVDPSALGAESHPSHVTAQPPHNLPRQVTW